jgi:hypothetical protein
LGRNWRVHGNFLGNGVSVLSNDERVSSDRDSYFRRIVPNISAVRIPDNNSAAEPGVVSA